MEKENTTLTKYFEDAFWYFKIFLMTFKGLLYRVLLLLFLCFLFFASPSKLFAQHTIDDNNITAVLKEIRRLQDVDEKSALNLLNEILAYEKKLPDSLLIKLYDTAATLYASQDAHVYALNYYHSELLLQKNTNSKDQYITLKNIGNLYYTIGKNNVAKEYWSEALQGYEKEGLSKKYVLYNNLAILEEKEGNYKRAKAIYESALSQSIKLGDNMGIFMAYQNLGIVSFKLQLFKEALNYSYKAKQVAFQSKEVNERAKILYNLGYLHYNLPLKNEDSTEYYLREAFLLSKESEYKTIQKASSEILISLYEGQKKHQLANFYLHEVNRGYRDELDKMIDGQIGKIEFKYEQKLKEQLYTLQQRRKNWIYFTSFLILVTGCVILFLVYKLQKVKLIKTGLENRLLLKKLEERNKEITQKSLEVLHKNEILDVTKRKLTDLKRKPEVNRQISSILSEINSNEKGLNIEEFEKVFKETHADFYRILLESYPDLSRTDLRLAAFLRLNLSTKDITAITGQSQNSINIARHRLRKKLNLQEHENIINFLISIV